MSLRQSWSRLNTRYAALSRRERALVALAVVFGPLLIGYSLFVDPQSARRKVMEANLATEEASVARLQAEAANLQQQLSIDPDAGRKADLAALNAERDKLDEQLRAEGAPAGLTVFKVDYDSRSDLRQRYGVTLQTTVVFVDDSGTPISSTVLYEDPSIASLIAAAP